MEMDGNIMIKRTIFLTSTIFLICLGYQSCIKEFRYFPEKSPNYKIEDSAALFNENGIALQITGKLGRPGIYEQTAEFTLKIEDKTDSLILNYTDILLQPFEKNKNFKLIDIITTAPKNSETIEIAPNNKAELHLYYMINDSSLVEPFDHFKRVTLKILGLKKKNKVFHFPDFNFVTEINETK